MPVATSSILNQLPVPLMLQMNGPQGRSDGQLISSVVAAPNNVNRSGQPDLKNRGARLNRRQVQAFSGDRRQPSAGLPGQQQHLQPASDILVRLVGHWHAKCALQYLLCYLLSSSVAILVCSRLFRMCAWRKVNHRARLHAIETNAGHSSGVNPDPASFGFYYRTRLGE